MLTTISTCTDYGCPPCVTTYCMAGRYGFNDAINGRYVYEGCYNDLPYFGQQETDSTEKLYAYFDENAFGSKILIDANYTNDIARAVFICYQDSFNECGDHYGNWYIWNGSDFSADDTVYFGDNCSYSLYAPSLCKQSSDFYPNISIDVAFDTDNISGEYHIVGCYKSYPYYKKKVSENVQFYLYSDEKDLNFFGSISTFRYWFVSYTLGDIWSHRAVCAVNVADVRDPTWMTLPLSTCSFFQISTQEQPTIDWESYNYTVYIASICGPLSFLIFIFMCYYSRKGIYSPDESDVPQNDNNINGGTAIELEEKTDTMRTPSHSKHGCKKTLMFIGKIVFLWIFKPGLEIYDYYTDVVLALDWLSGFYGLQHGTRCHISLDVYGYSLLIFCTVGFVIGVIGQIYRVKRLYCANKRLSYQSLDDLHQSYVTFFIFAKMLLEDVVSIVLFIVVAQNEVGIVTDAKWFRAYYTSCISFTVSCMRFLRKEANGGCRTVMSFTGGAKRDKVTFKRACCATIFVLLVLGLCMMPIVFLLMPLAMYKDLGWGFMYMKVGFVLNHNDCYVFKPNEPITGNENNIQIIGSALDGKYSFEQYYFVEEEYATACRGHSVKEGELLGMRCSLFERSDPTHTVCNFWMYSNQCWSGECLPYAQHLTACYGYIGVDVAD